MASQPAVKTAPVRQSGPSQGPSRKGSKPRVYDYSRYRVTIQKPEEFAAYLAGYPNKSGLALYIYRLLPKIDFGLIGMKEHTIRKVFELEQMNPEWVAREFGRGRYSFKLNDKLRDKGQTEVCSMVFEVTDPEREPVYDVRTLCLGAPENIDEINRLLEKGALIRDAAGQPRVRTERDGPMNGAAPAAVVTGSEDLIGREVVGKLILNMVEKGQQSPAQMLNQSIEIARLLRPENPQSSFTAEAVAELVIAKLGNGAVKGRAPLDPFDAWERIEAFLSKAGGGRAAAAVVAGGGSTTETMLAGVSEVLKGVAVVIPQIITGIDFIQKQKMRLAVSVNRTAGAPHQQHAPASNGAANGGGMGEQPVMTMAEKIEEIAQLAFLKMGEGMNGFDFAAYICQWHPGGLDVYRFLEPHGPVGVLGLLAMNPAAAPICNDPEKRPQLEKFLDDLFSYDPDGSAADESDEEGAAASA
jgi:hypothetical protein